MRIGCKHDRLDIKLPKLLLILIQGLSLYRKYQSVWERRFDTGH